MKLSIINPFSTQYTGLKDFGKLTGKQQAKTIISNTTVNMIFLFPTENAPFRGAFLGRGDTRTLIFRANNEVERVGALSGETKGVFQLEPGDYLFTSSDGIWHNASPVQVNAFIKTDLENGYSMQQAVERLVAATLAGRDDDRNPILLQVPA